MNKLLRARSVKPGDGLLVSQMMQRVTPLHAELIDRLPGILDQLAEDEAIIGTVVETISAKRQPEIVGATILSFISDKVAETYEQTPFPALTSNLLMQVEKGSTRPFLNLREQSIGNTQDGMHQVILEFAVEPMDFRHPDFAAIMNELYSAHFMFERGYNVKSVCVEAGKNLEALVIGTGMKPVKDLNLEGGNENIIIPAGVGTKRCFYKVDRSQLNALPPSCAAAIIMTYMRPTFKFTPTEQRLLRKSLLGLTDEQIAADLKISRDAIKQSWRTIYDHVMDVMPELLEIDGDTSSGRGAEKKRHIIAHVRNNLQELKPHCLRRG